MCKASIKKQQKQLEGQWGGGWFGPLILSTPPWLSVCPWVIEKKSNVQYKVIKNDDFYRSTHNTKFPTLNVLYLAPYKIVMLTLLLKESSRMYPMRLDIQDPIPCNTVSWAGRCLTVTIFLFKFFAVKYDK